MGSLRKITGNILGERIGEQLADLGFDLPISDIENPQKLYMWEFGITDNEATKDRLNRIRMFAMSTSLPERSNTLIKRHYRGAYYHYIGKETSPRTVDLKFFDTEDGHVYRYFVRWWQKANFGQDRMSLAPENIFKNVSIRLRDVMDTIDTQNHQMDMCFPIEIKQPVLTYEESGLYTFEVTLAFINFRINGEV